MLGRPNACTTRWAQALLVLVLGACQTDPAAGVGDQGAHDDGGADGDGGSGTGDGAGSGGGGAGGGGGRGGDGGPGGAGGGGAGGIGGTGGAGGVGGVSDPGPYDIVLAAEAGEFGWREGLTLYVLIWDQVQNVPITGILSAVIDRGTFHIPVQDVPRGTWQVDYFVGDTTNDELCHPWPEDDVFRYDIFFGASWTYTLGWESRGNAPEACEHFPQ